MKKVLLFTILVMLFIPTLVKADLIGPEWFETECPAGQQEVTCSYRSEEPFGPKTSDYCVKYENNSNFEYLTGHGSSFGGESKYCFLGQGNPDDYINKNTTPTSKKYLWIITTATALFIAGITALYLIRRKNRQHP
jgi:hypothetical protein